MKESALGRVARALNLIPFLAKNPGLSVVQIADRFQSTPVQISKDLSLLHMCGLPGYTHLELLNIDFDDPEAIFVADAQVLDQPRSLTQVETLTLVLGLQLLSEISGGEERVAIISLQERIGRRIEKQLATQITIADGVEESPLIALIAHAISNEQFLSIEYNSASSDSITVREIFPLSISYQNGIGYLQAIAKTEAEFRIFRIDRIVQLSPGAPVPGYAQKLNVEQGSGATELIEIEMGPDGVFFVEKHNEIVTSFDELGEGYRITLHAATGEWIVRTLLSWPSAIKVVNPRNLAQILHRRIAGALANYE